MTIETMMKSLKAVEAHNIELVRLSKDYSKAYNIPEDLTLHLLKTGSALGIIAVLEDTMQYTTPAPSTQGQLVTKIPAVWNN